MKLIRTLAAACILCLPALPCSAFLVVGSGEVFFANNEDYWTPDTRVWFEPAADGKHGIMYLGYSNGFPQGGMNDAGLAFDGFATKVKPLLKQKGKKRVEGNPINVVMETCATVDEVIAFLEKVDLRPLMTQAMLMFADANGDSVIIEGDQFIRKSGDYQVITNFYQSEQADDAGQCPRFDAATRALKARKTTTVESCAQALSAAAQRGAKVATLYSNVFDLKNRTATLWLFHDFETAVVLDLKAELAKGKRTLNLPELFPANKAFDKFVEARNDSVEKRIAKRRGPALTPAAMKPLEGSYEIEYEGKQHPATMRREKDMLVVRCETLIKSEDFSIELYSASENEFFSISESGELTVNFERDENGIVTGFVLTTSGAKLKGKRVTASRSLSPSFPARN